MIRQVPEVEPPRGTVATLRFYGQLNDFLPRARRGRPFTAAVRGTPTVKDVIERFGVPHTEIGLILLDGEPVGFARGLRGGARVAVYPEFTRLDVSPPARLRPELPGAVRFVAEVHLGTLARRLRGSVPPLR